MITDSEISTICRPIGTPLTTSARRMVMSSLNRCMSARPSHSVFRLCRMYSSRPASDSVCDTSVAQAEPAMPSSGNGPMPKISTGFRAMSSTTETSRKRNGVRESPAPRSAALRKAKAYSVGIARKMMRR
ncbi:hypothetical protein D3C72_1771030 [compost metagenome]